MHGDREKRCNSMIRTMREDQAWWDKQYGNLIPSPWYEWVRIWGSIQIRLQCLHTLARSSYTGVYMPVSNQKKFDTNSEPLSEVTWEGMPCLENTWRTNRRAKSADVMMSWAGIKIACLVSRSTMTKIVSNPEDDGSFSMNSMVVQG